MGYPSISIEQANQVFSAREDFEDLTDLINEVTLTKEGPDFEETTAHDVINQLSDLVESFLGKE